MSSLARFELRLLGGATLLAADGAPLAGRAVHRHRVALLALLALARPSGVSREKLIGVLWPERDAAAARHLLRAAIHELRQTLGAAVIEAVGDDLHLDATRVRVDVHAFEDALAMGDVDGAVAVYRGPFLDGLFLDDAEEFEQWVSAQRARLARRHEDALEALAERAAGAGDAARAAQWWRSLAERRPGDGRVVLHTMEALAAAGDRAGALALADAHVALLHAEYGAPPDAAVVACAARLREQPAAAPVATVAEPRPVTSYTPAPTLVVPAEAGTQPSLVIPAEAGIQTPVWTPAFAGVTEGAQDRHRRQHDEAVVPTPANARPASRARRWGLAVGLLALAALAGAWSLRARARPLAGAPDVLAVVPFDVVAGAPAELREGLPELLSANLDQVAGLRVVPARTSAARANELAGATPGRIARALGSDAVVTGAVAPAPGGVRVVAALVGAQDSTLARVEATGVATDLPALVDRVSVGLLREIWGRRWGVPEPRLAAVSTTSTAALRAYLRGEAYLRQALWDSAAAELAQAVDLDSTFALAHFRLAEPYGWRYGMASEPAERALAAARRFADRLPPRERALLSLRELHEAGDLRAVDTSAAFAERYPDDPEAQYVRADVRFHARYLLGEQFQRLAVASFDTATRVDSDAARVWAHPVTLALEFGDRARFDHAVARLTALTPGGHRQVADRPDYALLRAIRWSAPREAVGVLTERLRRAPLPRAWEVEDLLVAVERACAMADRPDPQAALAALDAVAAAYPDDAAILRSVSARRLNELLAHGRLAEARPLLEQRWARDPFAALAYAIIPMELGYAPREWALDAARRSARAADEERDPKRVRRTFYWRALLALAAGDAAAGRAALRVAGDPATPGDSVSRPMAGALRAAGGWARVVEGDTAGGLAEMTAGLRTAGYAGDALGLARPLRVVRTRLLVARDGERAEGMDMVRGELLLEGFNWAWWHHELARALDAQGDRAGAAAERARFAALWARADADARAALGDRATPVPVGGARR